MVLGRGLPPSQHQSSELESFAYVDLSPEITNRYCIFSFVSPLPPHLGCILRESVLQMDVCNLVAWWYSLIPSFFWKHYCSRLHAPGLPPQNLGTVDGGATGGRYQVIVAACVSLWGLCVCVLTELCCAVLYSSQTPLEKLAVANLRTVSRNQMVIRRVPQVRGGAVPPG